MIKRLTLIFFTCSLVLFSVFTFSDYPPCKFGSETRGGWGWQDSESCRVYPTCSGRYADNDGNNWGYEDEQTCIVYQTCSQRSLDHDGDGWGWERNQSCAVFGAFENEYAKFKPVACKNGEDKDGDGIAWQENQFCRHYPTCQNKASDTDDDNWGNENGRDCVVYQTCSNDESDYDGDGWGWENNESCSVAGAFREPQEPDSSPKTVLLNYLKSSPSRENKRVLSGAFGGYSGSTFSNFEKQELTRITGKTPAIYGCDYLNWDASGSLDEALDYSCNTALIQHHYDGGVVQINIHLPSPIASNAQYGLRDKLSNEEFASILSCDTTIPNDCDVRNNWLKMLAKIAKGLQQFKDKDIPVLFRPLHEVNSDWFWWTSLKIGDNDSFRQDLYKKLYQDMHKYMVSKDLDNLIWVFAPHADKPIRTQYYPGNNYVDIIGMDAYTRQPDNSALTTAYNELSTLNKPIALAEIGPWETLAKTDENGNLLEVGTYDYAKLIETIRKAMPNIIYFMHWDWVWSPILNQGATILYTDPWVTNLGEIQ